MMPTLGQDRRSTARAAGALDTLVARLEGARNTDGGWGYAPGKGSRIEPTCWALLALSRASGSPIDVEILARWPAAGGWLIDVTGAPVNYAFNALAGLALLSHRDGASRSAALASSLLTVRGLRLEQADAIRQDNSLQAWPWIEGTFSWVEPTSWCLLLMKKLGTRLAGESARERIQIGDSMLRDRACREGGWNYGSSNVYGQELFPYVPTTAIGLLALQDQKTDPVVSRSIDWLRRSAVTESSPLALSLAAIALRTYGIRENAVGAALSARLDSARPVDDVMGLAISLYATAKPAHGESVFAI